MRKRVTVNLNTPADAANKRDRNEQRVIEFGWNNPSTGNLQGGLIHFFPLHLTKLRVDLYRLDDTKVNIEEADSFKMAMILNSTEENVIIHLGQRGAIRRVEIPNDAAESLLARGLVKHDITETALMMILTDAGKYLYRQWKERQAAS